ncbi:hypothetical protein ACFYMW_24505 [Streptomyces sp. NPDC006692]|uniref:hypothetical protein n=1 Tax=unclassified Streptomyces TaxID=2593676 RepID=UPI002E2FED0F|nr:hypothetical protein [Streptomyces sp. NBC_01431]
MAEVTKMNNPTPTASSRPCGFVSTDKGNAPTITPLPKAESVPDAAKAEETSARA